MLACPLFSPPVITPPRCRKEKDGDRNNAKAFVDLVRSTALCLAFFILSKILCALFVLIVFFLSLHVHVPWCRVWYVPPSCLACEQARRRRSGGLGKVGVSQGQRLAHVTTTTSVTRCFSSSFALFLFVWTYATSAFRCSLSRLEAAVQLSVSISQRVCTHRVVSLLYDTPFAR